MRQFAPPAEGRLEILTPDDLQRLDEAALHVLATIGVAVPALAARAALLAAGAQVDGQTVRVPADVVRRLVALAPASLTLGARAHRTLVTGEGSLLTTDGCPTDIYDLETGAKRPTTAADAIAITRIVDALDEVDFCWTSVSAQDRPVERRGLYEIYDVLANTGKHVQTVTIVDQTQARVAVEMARAIAGGDLGVRRAPPISALLGTITPLGHDEGTLDAAFVFAAAGVPIGFVTMPQGGSTTPVTMAGSLTVGIAEALSGVCAVQAAFPGAPVFICFIPSVMDLRTGGYTGGGPEDDVLAAAATQVGRSFGLPVNMGTMATGAKEPGWQAGVDDALSTAASVLAGADMMSGAGMLDGSRTLSYPHLVMETELYRIVARLAQGIIVNDETLALDAIRRVGPNGTYLADKHTRRHLREIWQPAVWDRTSYDAWLAGGKRGALESAAEQAREILDSHVSAPLPDEVAAELRAIVARADGEFELSAVVGRVDTELS